MAVIVKTSFENARHYRGKNVVTKIENKKHNVYFRVVIDDYTIDEALKEVDSNILVYDYQGMTSNPTYANLSSTNLYITRTYELGYDISESDIIKILELTPLGVTPMLKLPNDYKDFEFICNMSSKYSRVRFCGGILFCVDGCKVGCCGRDILDKKSIKYNDNDYIKTGCACALDVFSDEDLDLELSDKKVKPKSSKSGNSSGTQKKKKKMFGEVFGGTCLDL